MHYPLCSSDIIESYFGKLKYKLSQNPKSGLTEFAYMIGVFGKDFSEKEAKKGLEHIRCKDLKLDENALKEGTKGGGSFRA